MMNPVYKPSRDRDHPVDRCDARPFASQWLDSAYQEAILHNTPWDEVKKMICDSLAKKIEKQRDEPQRMQMIFQLVGLEFKSAYFPDFAYEPFLLLPPNMNNEQLAKLRGEAQSWLVSQTQNAAKEVGCGRVPPGTAPSDDLNNQQLEFLQYTYEIFMKNLDRYIMLKESEEIQSQHKSKVEETKSGKKVLESDYMLQVLHRSDSRLSSVPSTPVSIAETTVNERVRGLVGEKPSYHCFQTETAAACVKQILQRDPKRFIDVAQRLHGRQLSCTLRTYCWLDVLFKVDRDCLREGNVEKIVRSRFISHVRRGVTDLSLKTATKSPISGLIENAVIETYNKTLAMQTFNVDDHLQDAARSLNVLYVFDRTYEPYLVHWIFPLQLAFREHAGTPEYVYELAMYLDLLNKNCFPSWPKIFAMADCSLLRLANVDHELYEYLKTIALEDFEMDSKEFMVYLIHDEKEKAQELLKLPPSDGVSKSLLADPLIFLRKWIGEGFVSVLDTPAVMFLWDQNFLQLWQGLTTENMCLALIELLRYKFMEARNYKEMKRVFLTEPGKLYTADIQRAWIHIERGGNPSEVQFFNRQRPVAKFKEPSVIQVDTKQILHFTNAGHLQSFGIKNIVTKFIISTECLYKEHWLVELNAENFKLMFFIYFGEHKIAHNLTMVAPTVTLTHKKDNSTLELTLQFTGDGLIFDHRQLMDKYRVLENAVPFIALRIDYLKVSEQLIMPTPLAWATVDSHTKLEAGTASSSKYKCRDGESVEWLINARNVQLALWPGVMPECVITTPPRMPAKKQSPTVRPGSEIRFTIFNPSETTPTGTPEIESEPVKSSASKQPVLGPELTQRTLEPGAHWKEHDSTVSAQDESQHVALTEPFDVYIDAIRFLPDNATIVKITGRFLKTGEVTNIPDIAAYPESDTDPKNPFFKFRLVLNSSNHQLDPDALLILRVYTLEKHSKELVVIGSCLLNCVKHGAINTGGFQLRLRSGMPDIAKGMQQLNSSSMDHLTAVPGVSILVRILPHEPDGYRVMPNYMSGYYQSAPCHPNRSELNIFEHHSKDDKSEKQWTEVIKNIKISENDLSPTEELSVHQYMEERMNPKRYLPPQTAARNLNLRECVRYRSEVGLSVHIRGFGIPEGIWSQCVVWVKETPNTVAKRNRDAIGVRRIDKRVTSRLDYTSAQKAPRWLDRLILHTYFDTLSYLVVEFYGFKCQYNFKSKQILGQGGKALADKDLCSAWAVLPLFINEALMTGDHLVAMYKGQPDENLLQRMVSEPVNEALKKERLEKYHTACLEVRLVDQHYLEEEFPIQPLPIYRNLPSGNSEAYDRVVNDQSGKVLTDLILKYMPIDRAKAGAFGSEFEREKKAFDKAAYDALISLLKSTKRL